MDRHRAYRIFGLKQGADKDAVKRKYRQLMRIVHPDMKPHLQENEEIKYSAQEINEAYEILSKEIKSYSDKKDRSAEGKTSEANDSKDNTANKKSAKGKRARTDAWCAPINPNAYCDRTVYQYAEDSEGEKIGEFCVAKGKYFWSIEEDFPLFLKSVYACGKEILDRIDDERGSTPDRIIRMNYQAELTYLLTVQFVDISSMLEQLTAKYSDSEHTDYYVSAMLELNVSTDTSKSQAQSMVVEGEYVYPECIKKHRLYVKNQMGQRVGYLSFKDDRLYYIVIPLLELKTVQIKMQIAKMEQGSVSKKQKIASPKYKKLDMWIRFREKENLNYPESIRMKIEALLDKYKWQGTREGE